MVILVDMDETLNEFSVTFTAALSKVLNKELKLEYTQDCSYELTGRLIPEYSLNDRMMYRDIVFKQPGFWLSIPTKPGAIRGMEILCSGHEVYVVTKPSSNALNSYTEKAQWLKNNFPFFPIKNLILTDNKSMITGDIMIDDDPVNLEYAITKEKAIFDMPYNYSYIADYRFNNWEEIVKTLLWK